MRLQQQRKLRMRFRILLRMSLLSQRQQRKQNREYVLLQNGLRMGNWRCEYMQMLQSTQRYISCVKIWIKYLILMEALLLVQVISPKQDCRIIQNSMQSLKIAEMCSLHQKNLRNYGLRVFRLRRIILRLQKRKHGSEMILHHMKFT